MLVVSWVAARAGPGQQQACLFLRHVVQTGLLSSCSVHDLEPTTRQPILQSGGGGGLHPTSMCIIMCK